MNYWVLTDTHFGHDKMHEYCQRPDDFEERILRQTRHKIKPEDVLIHLGDFCIGNDEYWHKQFMDVCPGFKWLVRGNHDRKSATWYHERGWHCVVDRIYLRMFGKKLLFSHRPIKDPGRSINIHGHHHNTGHHPEDATDHRHILIFIEHTYTPFSLRQIVSRA